MEIPKIQPLEKVSNIRTDPVDEGYHICGVCNKRKHHKLMIWTDGKVKLCLACYYDL